MSQVLAESEIPEDIIKQVSDMVAEAVDRALRQLMLNGGGPPPRPTGYVMPARTGAEVQLTPAAHEGHTSRARKGQLEYLEKAGPDILELAKRSKRAGLADPASEKPARAPAESNGEQGWLL